MPGPLRSAQQDNMEVLSLCPVGAGGVELFTHPSALGPEYLQRGENIRLGDGTLSRRQGAQKVYKASDICASKTFGATTKYALFTPPLIPKGGWALRMSLTAVRPSAGNTAYILSSRPSGQTFHVLKVTLSDAGVITVGWRDSGGSDRSVACTAVSDNSTVHLLAVYEPIAGTFTVYVNGSSSGTPVTGLSSTLSPDQTTGVYWAFGVEKQTGSAVTASSHFSGAIDGVTLFSLAGTRPASGSTTLVSTLLRHSFRQWPCPQMDSVLFNFDFDATGSVAYDTSRYNNNATVTGTPTDSPAVALASVPTNFIGSVDTPLGSRFNMIGSYGRMFYERVRNDS